MTNASIILLVSLSFAIIDYIYFYRKTLDVLKTIGSVEKNGLNIIKKDIKFYSFLFAADKFRKVFIISCIIVAIFDLSLTGGL